MKNLVLIFLSFFFYEIALAQIPPTFVENENIIIIENGDTLANPFFGGLNNPHFSDLDLNNDGIKDLVIFDKSNDRVYTLINDGIFNTVSYNHDKYYEQFFPEDLRDWMLLIDYNNDGIEDIFTQTISGIKVYKTFYTAGHIDFELVSEKLLYTGNSGNPTNVYCSSIDVPGIADVNGDGDIDILNFSLQGSTLKYYENQSVENGYSFDSLYFEKVDDCWGNFTENASNSGINLNTFCQPSNADEEIFEPEAIHAGSTILAFDYDFDEDIDLLLGDVSSKNLILLINGGNATTAHIDTFYPNFPQNTQAIDVYLYPAAFLLDVNNDGTKDILTSPNESYLFENFNQISYYKGIPSSIIMNFEFVQNNFLVEEMIDLGETAVPTIVDFDLDGKQDLLIGNYGYFNTADTSFKNTLTAYKNIGDSSNLVFELYDRDFNNLSQQQGYFGIYPVFEDFDFDGDLDMICITFDGKINYFENVALAGAVMDLQLSIANINNINIGGGSQPFSCLYDYNNDSLPDLIVGERAGNLNLLKNNSVGTNISFSLEDSFWGNVNTVVSPDPHGYAAPFITKLDSTQKDYLLVHNLNGTINLYTDLDQAIFTKLDTFYNQFNTGGLGGIFVGDLNKDNYLDLLVGNKRGGINILTQTAQYFPLNFDSNFEYFSASEISIFPNPIKFSENININFSKAFKGKVVLLNLEGKIILQRKINQQTNLSLNHKIKNNGIYFIQFISEEKTYTKKILIQD